MDKEIKEISAGLSLIEFSSEMQKAKPYTLDNPSDEFEDIYDSIVDMARTFGKTVLVYALFKPTIDEAIFESQFEKTWKATEL